LFVPKSIVCLREGITREQLLRDLMAGVVVGVVALPLALAFAIASGVPPERGLYTAIIAGFLISALGGSRVQIGGPTGAFVVIVYGIVTKFGYNGLVICTLIAGFILIVMGLARMGALIKFIPYPVVTGFTSGIAVIIFSNEIKDFFGLKMGNVPADLMDKWVAYWDGRSTVNGTTLLVALFTLAILIVWPRISRFVPGPFIAMVAATLVVHFYICRWKRSRAGSAAFRRHSLRRTGRRFPGTICATTFPRRSQSHFSQESNRYSRPSLQTE
jgi:SulP family sulfate permease